jgi:hypothetical protein
MHRSTPSDQRSSDAPARRVLSRRISHFWWTYQWPILIVLWFAMMLLGYIGFWLYYRSYPLERPHTPGDLVYYTMQLVPLISGALPHPVPMELEIARHLLPVIEGYAGVVAIVIAISGGAAVLRVIGMHDHVVICGLGRKGALLARRFREAGQSVVVVERDPDAPQVTQCRDEGFIVLIGDATQAETLRHARVGVARQVIGVCGDDGVNADIVASVHALVKGRGRTPIVCAVHVVDPWLYWLLREQELSPAFAGSMRLELFNVYALGAREMLSEHPLAVADGSSPPHVLVVGLGQLARSVIIQLALDWQPRFRATGARLQISVLGHDAERRSEALRQRYPRLGHICELIPYAVDVHVAGFQCAPCVCDADGRTDVSAAYVCLVDETLALAAGLTLAHDLGGCSVPIVVRVDERAGLVRLAQTQYAAGGDGSPATSLYAFPLLERTCTPAIVLGGAHETLARAIHEAYVLREVERGATVESNPSLVPWDALPERLQEADRAQADHIGVKLAAAECDLEPLTDWDADRFSFTTDEVERLAELEHARWVADYQRAGWRHSAADKDVEATTHPSLAPWGDLSEVERDKDRDVVRLLPVLLARAGFQIVRRQSAGVDV